MATSAAPIFSAVSRTASATRHSSLMSSTRGSARPPGKTDLLGGRVDPALQIGMKLSRLCGKDDIQTVSRGAKRDGQSDTAAGARDEDCLSREAHLRPSCCPHQRLSEFFRLQGRTGGSAASDDPRQRDGLG